MRNRSEMVTQLRQWGESTDAVRAIILTSSKANPHAVDDLLSDYDVWCIVSDLEFVYENERWYEALGSIIATLCGDYIEWYIGLQHGWAVGTNKHGRWF